jgi:hypothetical protein
MVCIDRYGIHKSVDRARCRSICLKIHGVHFTKAQKADFCDAAMVGSKLENFHVKISPKCAAEKNSGVTLSLDQIHSELLFETNLHIVR